MSDETTSRLEQILKGVNSLDDAENFIKEHATHPRFFFEYLNGYIAKKKIVVSEMIERSGISRNYIYNIINGVTKQPGRDKIIAICIGAGMTVEELNRGLRIAGYNPLYPKNSRDIHIASCINRGIKDVTSINIDLEKVGVSIIDV